MADAKKFFLTFADSRMQPTLTRIEKEADELDVFDGIFAFNENDLGSSFVSAFRPHLILGSRGFGYWRWKPQVVLQVLEKIKEGDLVLYADAGCHLNKNGKNRLLEYFEILKNDEKGLVGFECVPPSFHDGRTLYNYFDAQWTKGDLIQHLKMSESSPHLYSPSIAAGIFLIKKTEESVSFIKKWKSIFEKNFELLDDSLSKSKNPPEFIEHRHDQAAFSLLAKQKNIFLLSSYEFYYPSREDLKTPDWNSLEKMPIHAKRIRQLTRKQKFIKN